MTIDEAIYCLNAESECCQELCDECPLYGQVGTDHCYEDALHMAIESLKFKKEYQAKVQKCIERMDKIPCVVDQWNKKYLDFNEAIEIIKEEMGVEE